MTRDEAERRRWDFFNSLLTEKEYPMEEMALVLGILVVWVLLQSVVLPRLGVST